MHTYQTWLQYATEQLQQSQSESPRSDSMVLLQAVTKKSRSFLHAFAETKIDTASLQTLTALLQRRQKGEPIAYILGEKEFWSLSLKVSPHTLIPRPDTEILVETALKFSIPQITSKLSEHFSILDLGTGTGAVALALASELAPLAKKCGVNLAVLGVDRIVEAVELAKENAQHHQLAVDFQQSSWFSQLADEKKFDLIVSNPPYIDELDPHLIQGDVRFEPRSALVAEQQGYADLHHIIENAPHFLKKDGYLLLEHGWQQGSEVRRLFQQYQWSEIETYKDYGQNERVTLGRARWNL